MSDTSKGSRSFFLDLSPLLKVPAYRRLWLGSLLSSIGNLMTVFAVTLQIYQQTQSSLAVGVVGLFTGLPAIVVSLWGGSLADYIEKRTLLFITTALQMLISCVLLWQAWVGLDNLWLLYAAAGLQFLFGAINVPTGAALVPILVGTERLEAAAALRTFAMHCSMIGGPIVGGLVAARCGIQMVYLVDVLSFIGALYAIARLPKLSMGNAGKKTLAAVREGFAFIAASHKIKGALAVDLALAFFGVPLALLPALNSLLFAGSQEVLGWMYAAPAIGGLLASVLSGRLADLQEPGRMMAIFCVAWGITVSLLALATPLYFFLVCLLVMGALDTFVLILRSSIIQRETPDSHRGRVSAFEYVVGNVSPQLGNVRAGLLAVVLPPTFVAMVGGLSTIAVVLVIARYIPAFSPLPQAARLDRRQ